jgi:RNA polymerase sigma factor (sigma-70 family)
MVKLRENAELLQAFRRGDRAALGQVYDDYAPSLIEMLKEGFAIESSGTRYLFEGYREPWRLETAVQEVFTRAFAPKARDAYDGLRPYKNYLYTIARNHIVDNFRKKKINFLPLEDIPEQKQEDLTDPPSPYGSPEAQAVNQELKALVDVFIAGLDSFDKEIFTLRFQRNLSVERTAELAKVTEYRIKRTEKSIKKRFYNLMRRKGYFEGFRFGKRPTNLLIILLLGAGGII